MHHQPPKPSLKAWTNQRTREARRVDFRLTTVVFKFRLQGRFFGGEERNEESRAAEFCFGWVRDFLLLLLAATFSVLRLGGGSVLTLAAVILSWSSLAEFETLQFVEFRTSRPFKETPSRETQPPRSCSHPEFLQDKLKQPSPHHELTSRPPHYDHHLHPVLGKKNWAATDRRANVGDGSL